MRSRALRDLAVGCVLAALGVAGAAWQVERASAPAEAREQARSVLVCPLGTHVVNVGRDAQPAR